MRFLRRDLTVELGNWVETALVEHRLVIFGQRRVVRHNAVHGCFVSVSLLFAIVIGFNLTTAGDAGLCVCGQNLTA